ncbi:MAG: NAD synthetase [Candidatus Nanopelagicus sp.]
MTDKGHWEFQYDFDIAEWFGFIYRITEISTGKQYLGKRQFHQHLRKTVKGKKNKKKVIKESDWKNYTGSSVRLNTSIELTGKENYKFEIMSLHKTRASLVYAEVKLQISEDVLRTRLPDGSRKFYNGLVSGIKFVPPEDTAEEIKMRA